MRVVIYYDQGTEAYDFKGCSDCPFNSKHFGVEGNQLCVLKRKPEKTSEVCPENGFHEHCPLLHAKYTDIGMHPEFYVFPDFENPDEVIEPDEEDLEALAEL